MKQLIIVECKTCFIKFNGEDARISIGPHEEIEVIIRRIAKCSQCKQFEDRTMGGRNKRFNGNA